MINWMSWIKILIFGNHFDSKIKVIYMKGEEADKQVSQ